MQAITSKKLLSSFIALFALFLQLSSQQNPVDALKKLYDDYPQEKIYIWFNKAGYVAGETIWFKAYIFSGYDVSFISSSLYIEFYDSEKKLISKKLLPVLSGIAEGSMDIDAKLNEGVYYIRAYTHWMLNFKEEFQYIRPILVYNTVSAKKLTPDNSMWKAMAAPEGGSLIEGVETKISVRRIANMALPNKWGGYLYEESNPVVKITEFTSLDENAALFSFTPEGGKKYYIRVKDENENFQVAALPAVKSSGVALSIAEVSDSITYQLKFHNIPGNGNGYNVLGEVQHQTVYFAQLKKTTAELKMKIPFNVVDNGILHITVFDPDKKAVAERLVFLNSSKLNYDSSVLFQQSLSAQRRAGNEVQLTVDSVSWLSYAISVSDAATPSSIEEENILSALWLTSDLINPIQNPAKYFTDPDEKKAEALDAILISEKWERYDWNDLLNNKFPKIKFPSLNYLTYTGRVTKGNKLKPNEDVNLFLYTPDSSSQIILTRTDSVGNLFLDNLAFVGDARIFYQLNSKKYVAKLIDVEFERNNRFVQYSISLPQTSYILSVPASATKSPLWVERAASSVKLEKDIEDKYKSLQEVVVQSKLRSAKEQLNNTLSSGLFRTMSEIVFDFVNEEQHAIGYSNIIQWLQGRVAGLTVQFQNGDYVPYIRGSEATIYLDEMRIEPNLVTSISISDIAMIKVIKGPFALMTGSGGGTIAIYTTRGNMRPAQKEPSLPNGKIEGYDLTKEFFSPDYDDKSKAQPDKDTRDQLLWQTLLQPTLAVDRSKVNFYNNDNTRRFRVVVQGFTEKGFPVFFHRIIEPSLKGF
jgi:hypothetical protein